MTEAKTESAKNEPNPEVEAATERARKFEADATDARRQLKEIGMTAAEVKALRQGHDDLMRERANSGDPKKVKEFEEAVESKYKTAYTKEIEGLRTESQKKDAELKELRVMSVAMQMASEKGVLPSALPLIKRELQESLDWQDGKIVVLQDGKPALSKLKPGELMGLEEHFDALKGQYAFAFESENISGGKGTGTTSKSNGATTLTREQFLALPEAKRAEVVSSLEPAAARAILKNFPIS